MRSSLRVFVGLCGFCSALSCGGGDDGGTPPVDVNTMAKNAGDGQIATVGEAAPVAASVRITNQNQAPVPNIAVTFAVASGGGQVTGGSTTTNASGIATAGAWTMGTAPGPNTLTATSAGINGSPLTFTVTANVGPPRNITKQTGDNQTGSPTEAVAIKPSVKVTDQYGNPVAGVAVTFTVASGGGSVTGGTATTGLDGVATVGNWNLGPNQGANTLTATITGTGITGNPATFSATGQFVALAPTTNTAISGDKTYSSVNIPAGVTLTINTDAVITVTGDYTQAGVVTAPCHALRITATGVLTATGNVSNVCTDPNATGQDLVLIGRSGYSLSGNVLDSSGDIWIMDGPNLALPAVSARSVAPTRPARQVLAAGPYRCRLDGVTLNATPTNLPPGSASGVNGKSGTSRTSGCGQLLTGQTGGNLLVNNLTMNGGSGADGVNVTGAATAIGGNGGEPGALNIVADGDIDVTGNVTLRLGNGGNGGTATAGPPANAGGSATATGGRGSGLKPKNFSSPVTISSRFGTLTVGGTLNVIFGHAGNGGTATATGANGAPGVGAGVAGGKGGDATANGGDGGDGANFSLSLSGAVVVLGQVLPSGGAPGNGGASIRNPGTGGAGGAPGGRGGDGGNAVGVGGTGGKATSLTTLPNVAQAAVITLPSGNAGNSTSSNGKGGDGAPACPNTGGAGGTGGTASGGGGSRGPGSPAGAVANVTFNTFGNGGNGAAGSGAAGAGGTNNTTFGSGTTGTPPAPGSFQPGQPGAPCPSTNVNLDLSVFTPPVSPGGVSPGTYTLNLRDAVTSNVVGTMALMASGAGSVFYGTSPPRVGWGSTGSWTADLGSARVSGLVWLFTAWRVCIINSTVALGSPVVVELLDQLNTIIQTVAVTSLLPCQNIVLPPGVRFVRHRMTGSGPFADANGMGGTGAAAQGASIRKP